jgi:glycosyltransferase involved in cell wall biosynthesis
MRVLITASNQGVVGGIEKYLQLLIPALSERGHEVGILCEYRAGFGEERVDPPGAGLPVWVWDEAQPDALRQELVEWRPDVVYANGFKSIELESMLLDDFPVVLYAHVYQGTCITGGKCHAFPDIRPCHRRFGPACLVMYYPRRCGGLNPVSAWRMYQTQSRRNAGLNRYANILVASSHMYQEFRKHDVSDEKVRLVPLPVVDESTEVMAPSSEPASRILYIGRLTGAKGVANLIRAVPQAAESLNRPLTLTIAGEGGERSILENLASRIGASAEFLGWVAAEQKRELLRAADLLAVPSLWPEPFGLVGIEAGGYGVPSVGYAVGGIPDWLIAGQTGELAPGDPPTVSGLAAAIVRALADPDHHARLGRGARELARRFTLDAHVNQLEQILLANAGVVREASAVKI